MNVPSERNGIEGAKLAVVRRSEYELNLKGLKTEDLTLISKILYKAHTDETWGEYELDHIYFAKKHTDEIQYSLNHNEVSDIQFVSKTNILDFLNDEVKKGRGQITPWFKLILHTKLFGWWDHIEKHGMMKEDTSNKIINYIEGPDAVDMDQFVNISSTKEQIHKHKSTSARHFSTFVKKNNAQNSLSASDFTKSQVGFRNFATKQEIKEARKLEAEAKKAAEKEQFYAQQEKDVTDKCANQFGEKNLMQINSTVPITKVSTIDHSLVGQEVTIRARVHNIRYVYRYAICFNHLQFIVQRVAHASLYAENLVKQSHQYNADYLHQQLQKA